MDSHSGGHAYSYPSVCSSLLGLIVTAFGMAYLSILVVNMYSLQDDQYIQQTMVNEMKDELKHLNMSELTFLPSIDIRQLSPDPKF